MDALSRELARIPRWEPRADLEAQIVLAVCRRDVRGASRVTWWAALEALGAAAALVACLGLVAQALLAFDRAGGAELLSLIGSYPHLLLSYPQDAALAVLEALPVGNVVLSLASAFVAWLLGMRLLVGAPPAGHRPHPSGGF